MFKDKLSIMLNTNMLEDQAIDYYNLIEPLLAIIIVGVIGLWIKTFIEDLVASIRWKIKPGFEPGDECFLDGEKATIVSIGYRETIFEIDNGRGKVWRYVDNKRIPAIRLERIIAKKD